MEQMMGYTRKKMRLIDASKLKPYQGNDIDGCKGVRAVVLMSDILNAPTIEAKPVRHGHWVPKSVMIRQPYAFNHTCSACGKETNYCGDYCSNCGAKMDEVGK